MGQFDLEANSDCIVSFLARNMQNKSAVKKKKKHTKRYAHKLLWLILIYLLPYAAHQLRKERRAVSDGKCPEEGP